MVAAICDLGRALGLDVIAEDVEHAAQRTALLALDCVLAQGYWTSRPIDADGFHAAMTRLEARLHEALAPGTGRGAEGCLGRWESSVSETINCTTGPRDSPGPGGASSCGAGARTSCRGGLR
jgi:EAL domain